MNSLEDSLQVFLLQHSKNSCVWHAHQSMKNLGWRSGKNAFEAKTLSCPEHTEGDQSCSLWLKHGRIHSLGEGLDCPQTVSVRSMSMVGNWNFTDCWTHSWWSILCWQLEHPTDMVKETTKQHINFNWFMQNSHFSKNTNLHQNPTQNLWFWLCSDDFHTSINQLITGFAVLTVAQLRFLSHLFTERPAASTAMWDLTLSQEFLPIVWAWHPRSPPCTHTTWH